MPTTIIFVRPLWIGPEKQVWSFTRFRTSTPADSNAWRSIQHVARSDDRCRASPRPSSRGSACPSPLR